MKAVGSFTIFFPPFADIDRELKAPNELMGF
jgi:hypothetical protein